MTRRALVLGLGRFGGGREAARFLRRRDWAVRVADRATAGELRDGVAALRDDPAIEWALGREDEALLDDVQLLVVNPAVPPTHPLLAAAARRGVALTQEVELLLEHYPGSTVLVTGTNGKSTTATLLARALQHSEIPVLLGGNIGHSLLANEAEWRQEQIAVLEISSFQLERLDPRRRRVAGAVLTRITADHLDRHGSLAAYRAAKSRAAAAARDFVVHQADDDVAAGFATPAARRVTCAATPPQPGQVGIADGWLLSRLGDCGRVAHTDALRLHGAFHWQNALAAFAAAHLLGADRQRAGLALCTQPPLPHRLERLLEWRGVTFYDNGVSTEVQSTASALRSFDRPVRWVGGGKSKDGDYDAVARAVAPAVASAHLFGTAARPLAARLRRASAVVTEAGQLEDALAAAWRHARPGEVVLFSPAFASYDQYPNFEARAQAYRQWLRQLTGVPAFGGA